MLGPQPYHLAGEKYVTAALDAAGAIPVIVPALGRELQDESLLASLHGLLFTGSPSNVEPHRYNGDPSDAGTLHDPHRDETTLPLIPRAVAAGVPVLGICRGFQEMNVAFGGTLWQKLHEVPGHLDHREDK
jgi:putative glutamine amidotransferase